MTDKFRIDSTKIMLHPHRVAQWLDKKDSWDTAKDIYPLYVEVSPTGICNHRCTFCAVDYLGYKADYLDREVFKDRIHEMSALGIKSIMMGGEGEPLIHPHINEMVYDCVLAGVDVSFTTNGTLLHKLKNIDYCTWIKVSLNAGTRETYAKVHRTKPEDFDRVLANLADAVQRKGNCTIGAQMVLLPENQHEVETLQQIGKDIGLDYVVVKPYSQHKSSITTEYEKFVPEAKTVVWKSHSASDTPLVVRKEAFDTQEIPYDKCNSTPYLWAYLMSNGDLYSCSAYLLDDRFNLGNLNKQTFQEIWHGDKRKANWEFVRNELDIKDCRLNCRMDKTNRYLNDLVNGVAHKNFI